MAKKTLIVFILLLLGVIIWLPQVTNQTSSFAFDQDNINKSWAGDLAYISAKMNLRFWQFDAARRILEKAIITFPNEDWIDEAHYQIALCFEKNKEYKNAIDWYESFISQYPQHKWTDQAKKKIINIKTNL